MASGIQTRNDVPRKEWAWILSLALATSWGCLADTSRADVEVPGDGDATPPDDGNPPDAFPSDGADDPCRPARLPSCTRDGVPVSCDLAVAYQNGWSSIPTSPRGLCESLCDRGHGLDSLNQDLCLEYGGCWTIEGLECDACCTLSYLPPSARPNDDDPCTADACAGDTCTHDPYEWIGQPCQVRNDFGTCTGLLSCDSWCPTDSLDCTPGVHRCSARTPDADLVNGIDDDCDGTTDEGTKDGVLRLSEDGDVLDLSLVALTDGRFVVAWRTCVSPNFYMAPTCQVHLRTGTRDDPLGGLPVTPDEGDSSAPCLWPLADGRFAVAWNSTDDTDPRAPVSTQHFRILRGAAEPPDYAWDRRQPDDGLIASCAGSVTWPDGTMAFRVAPGDVDSTERIFLQRYDRYGPQGAPFELQDAAGSRLANARSPQFLGTAEGRILAGWQSRSDDHQNRATFFARWYGPDGTPLTDVLRLTDETYRSQAVASGPVLAELQDGRALSAWTARPIYDDGRYFRTLPIPATGLPDAAPAPFGSDPPGRPEGIGLSAWGGVPVLAWKDMEDKAEPTRLAATWLDPATFLPTRQWTLPAPPNGIIEDARMATLADGTVALAWIYQADPLSHGPKGLRLVLVPR